MSMVSVANGRIELHPLEPAEGQKLLVLDICQPFVQQTTVVLTREEAKELRRALGEALPELLSNP